MSAALPSLKNAARELVGAMRPGDAIAIYSFSERLDELQEFTTNRASARRALARLRASGRTALFDAIGQLAVTLEKRPGKKAIVVLTDGNDNASVLNLEAAALRARKAGVPIFAIAEGEALQESALLKLLNEMSTSTGGQMYRARNSGDINHVFASIAKDLQDAYLLTYHQPEAEAGAPWRAIQVVVLGANKPMRVRARTGYQPQ
jgi:VWFA-related protein